MLLWRVVTETCGVVVVGDCGIGVGAGVDGAGVGDAAEDEEDIDDGNEDEDNVSEDTAGGLDVNEG